MNKDTKIYIAGHKGLVGSAIWNNLISRGYTNLVGRTHRELDLLDGSAVKKFFDEEQPEAVVLAAAHVGGIMANNIYRADFIYNNLQIQQNVIGESFRHNVKKLLFLGSTCIYPREAPQPMKEDCLLTDTLEYTNEPYAIAKIAGLKMCESFNIQYGTNYIAVMPTNLYGPNDNFHLEKSHVLPAMIRKIHLAKCLNENDWESVRKDLNLRPVEGIDGNNSDEEILTSYKYKDLTEKELFDIWAEKQFFVLPINIFEHSNIALHPGTLKTRTEKWLDGSNIEDITNSGFIYASKENEEVQNYLKEHSEEEMA